MEWLTDTMMFYGGMAAAGIFFVAVLIFFCVSQIRMIRLRAQLEAEYGKNPKGERQKHGKNQNEK